MGGELAQPCGKCASNSESLKLCGARIRVGDREVA